MTVSQPLPVPGTVNFRDLGGYPVADGQTRRHVVFRSDGLSNLGDEGRGALRDLGIRTIVDLRDDAEVSAMPDDTVGLDARAVAMPLFAGSVMSMTERASLTALYTQLLSEHGDSLVAAIRALLEAEATPAIVHCTAGKDRTGVVSALILLSVGVDLETVLDDYAATAANLAGPWTERMSALASEHGVELTPELLEVMTQSPREVLDDVLRPIAEAEGGVNAYLAANGLTVAERDRLHQVLVERTEL